MYVGPTFVDAGMEGEANRRRPRAWADGVADTHLFRFSWVERRLLRSRTVRRRKLITIAAKAGFRLGGSRAPEGYERLRPVVGEETNAAATPRKRAIAQPQPIAAAMGVRPNNANKARVAIAQVSRASAATNCLCVIGD
jgi:hypothetical protein